MQRGKDGEKRGVAKKSPRVPASGQIQPPPANVNRAFERHTPSTYLAQGTHATLRTNSRAQYSCSDASPLFSAPIDDPLSPFPCSISSAALFSFHQLPQTSLVRVTCCRAHPPNVIIAPLFSMCLGHRCLAHRHLHAVTNAKTTPLYFPSSHAFSRLHSLFASKRCRGNFIYAKTNNMLVIWSFLMFPFPTTI